MNHEEKKNEIVIYQPNETIRIEVVLQNETVWLNRKQMAELFGRNVKTIGKHIKNALSEELSESYNIGDSTSNRNPVVANFATTATDGKVYSVEYYSLDVVLSVGYRVKSTQGIAFRRWSNEVLKSFLINGYIYDYKFSHLEERIDKHLAAHDKDISYLKEKVDFFVQTQTPPLQGVFFEGQLWDACSLVEKLIARAKSSILLIDNWVSVETLDMLAKKNSGVAVSIVTSKHGNKLAPSDIAKFNAQYPTLTIKESAAFHDRFLILDDKEIYLIGASLKDLGKKCFAFTKMDASTIPSIKAQI